ncbi:hypothetical protein Tco_0928338 [Tanacetum coccineum]
MKLLGLGGASQASIMAIHSLTAYNPSIVALGSCASYHPPMRLLGIANVAKWCLRCQAILLEARGVWISIVIQILYVQPGNNILKNISDRFERPVTELGHLGDVRSVSIRHGDVKLLLVAFDSQLKVLHPLLNGDSSSEHP